MSKAYHSVTVSNQDLISKGSWLAFNFEQIWWI